MNNIENGFLEYITETQIPVTIYLVNGVRLEGKVYQFDNSSILMSRDGFYSQMIYKNSIATIMLPPKDIYIHEEESEPELEKVETKNGWW